MTDLAAIKGTFEGTKPVKSRKVVQVIIELPIEHEALVHQALGYGWEGNWVGIARLDKEMLEQETHGPVDAPNEPKTLPGDGATSECAEDQQTPSKQGRGQLSNASKCAMLVDPKSVHQDSFAFRKFMSEQYPQATAGGNYEQAVLSLCHATCKRDLNPRENGGPSTSSQAFTGLMSKFDGWKLEQQYPDNLAREEDAA